MQARRLNKAWADNVTPDWIGRVNTSAPHHRAIIFSLRFDSIASNEAAQSLRRAHQIIVMAKVSETLSYVGSGWKLPKGYLLRSMASNLTCLSEAGFCKGSTKFEWGNIFSWRPIFLVQISWYLCSVLVVSLHSSCGLVCLMANLCLIYRFSLSSWA